MELIKYVFLYFIRFFIYCTKYRKNPKDGVCQGCSIGVCLQEELKKKGNKLSHPMPDGAG